MYCICNNLKKLYIFLSKTCKVSLKYYIQQKLYNAWVIKLVKNNKKRIKFFKKFTSLL